MMRSMIHIGGLILTVALVGIVIYLSLRGQKK
jgi:hypothetical protein